MNEFNRVAVEEETCRREAARQRAELIARAQRVYPATRAQPGDTPEVVAIRRRVALALATMAASVGRL